MLLVSKGIENMEIDPIIATVTGAWLWKEFGKEIVSKGLSSLRAG